MSTPAKVSARARTRPDKAGDPLDGLVNLFDLGIVLAVAFLLAALSSVNLSTSVLAGKKAVTPKTAPAGSVVKNKDQVAQPITLQPGQTVVGQGKELGTVYQLSDGRTVIVRKGGRRRPAAVTPATTPGCPAHAVARLRRRGRAGAGRPPAACRPPLTRTRGSAGLSCLEAMPGSTVVAPR